MIFLLREEFAIQFISVGQSGIVSHRMAEHIRAVCVLIERHLTVINPHFRVLETVLHMPDRQCAITMPRVHHIGTSGTVLALTIDDDAQELTHASSVIIKEHLHRKQVIGRRAEIRVQDDKRFGVLWCGFIIFLRRTGRHQHSPKAH